MSRAAVQNGKAKRNAGADDVGTAHAEVIGLMRAGRLLEAQARCQRALEAHPQHAELLHLMALVNFNAQQFDHAAEWAARAIASDRKPTYLTTLGTVLLNLGRHQEAVTAFDEAVRLKPDDGSLWGNLGDALNVAGRGADAHLCFRRSHELDPANPRFNRTRGAELCRTGLDEMKVGRLAEAHAACQQALADDPERAEAMHLMGQIHLGAQQFDGAIEWTSRAIGKDAKPDYLTTLGSALLRQGRTDEALKAFEAATRIEPNQPNAWWQLGLALIEAGHSDNALLCIEHVINLDPGRADASFKAGHLLERAGRLDEALVRLNRSAELQPNHLETLHLRAMVLSRLARFEESIADNTRALELDPQNFALCCNIGNALRALGRPEAALEWYDRSLALNPNVTGATNKAVALNELGRFDKAMAAFRYSLSLDAGQAGTIWNYALLQLAVGDFEAGWRGREARWKIPELGIGHVNLSTPMWLGDGSVAGKTIMIWQDEGLGDVIQFARYIPMLAARGARIVLVIEKALCPLLDRLDGVSQCVPRRPDMVVPPFDLHIAIDSLPLAFATTLETIPASESYLPAPASDRVQHWDTRIGSPKKLRVGLVWAGNPSFKNDRNRSLPFPVLAGILDVDATFVSLQKDVRPDDVEPLKQTAIVDHTAELTDFAETAALISCLDIVITVDTSVAHLAAALGRPTWVLVPHVADWRWLMGRDDSPWYPTVHLFRQSETREYGSVVARMRTELADAVARKNANS